MKRNKVAGSIVLAVVGLVVLAAFAVFPRTPAGSTPQVVVMRCIALDEPHFSYQVATLSETSDLDLDIAAATAGGEGDDCADAISRIVASGFDGEKLTMHATANTIVVTAIDD